MANSKTSDVLSGNILYSDTFWADVRVSANSTKVNPATSKPDFDVFRGSIRTFLFDPSSIESVHFLIQMPHSYKLGTALYPHIHWAPINTGSGTVKWSLEYTIANEEDAFPTTTTITVTDNADETAYKHQVISLSAISGTGITDTSAMIACRLFRDATSDTYASDAAFLEFDIHFEIDRPGSREQWIK